MTTTVRNITAFVVFMRIVLEHTDTAKKGRHAPSPVSTVQQDLTVHGRVFPSGPLAGLGWVAGLRGSILLLDLSVLEI